MAKEDYGVDRYSRYVDIDGERLQVEVYPYWKPFNIWTIKAKISSYWYVLVWYWNTRDRRHLWKL